jgi:hypothetical protein
LKHVVIQKFFEDAQPILVVKIVAENGQTWKNDANFVAFYVVQAILRYFQHFEDGPISRFNLAYYPKIFRKFDQFLSLSCIDQTNRHLLLIQDAVSEILVEIDLDEIFEVFLNLQIIEVKDVDEFAVILFDPFQLGQVVAVGVDAQIV